MSEVEERTEDVKKLWKELKRREGREIARWFMCESSQTLTIQSGCGYVQYRKPNKLLHPIRYFGMWWLSRRIMREETKGVV